MTSVYIGDLFLSSPTPNQRRLLLIFADAAVVIPGMYQPLSLPMFMFMFCESEFLEDNWGETILFGAALCFIPSRSNVVLDYASIFQGDRISKRGGLHHSVVSHVVSWRYMVNKFSRSDGC